MGLEFKKLDFLLLKNGIYFEKHFILLYVVGHYDSAPI